ncbi:MAG: aminotransferase DegT [Legionellales bacterium]|nr:aminotransferase DegT [Legionellales bacterium]
MQFIDLPAQYQHIKPRIKQRIEQVLEHGQYIMGPEIAELEQQLANYVGARHAFGVSNGTDALLMALMALGIQAGDEVITSPFSFFAPVEMLLLLGIKPVFVDIDSYSYHLRADLIEAAITERTKAILPVSLYGQCIDFDAINAVANQYRLPVIEDAAQSFGATDKGRFSCGQTTLATTSFFPSKPLGAYGDAGACFTNDDELADKLRYIRIHGDKSRYEHCMVGLNARMDSLQAAILLSKLEIFPQEVTQRQLVAQRYTDLLSDVVVTPQVPAHGRSVYAQYTIQVNDRDGLRAFLQEKGIPTAVHYDKPVYQQPIMQTLGYDQVADCPVTEQVANQVLSLPMHPYLTEEQQHQIASCITEYVADVALSA